MTEAQWLACTDPVKILAFVYHSRVSERKLRLFACACCGRIGDLLPDDHYRAVLRVVEAYADGQVSMAKLTDARESTSSLRHRQEGYAVWLTTTPAEQIFEHTRVLSDIAARFVSFIPLVVEDERRAQADLCRDVFRPFRPLTANPAWLAWNGGTVAKMARTIYDDRSFTELPILADALEDAGCDNAEILTHCRSAAEHARGCWVVDLLLGKS
jgi:hypothetical protein